jgi:hypothetical protein
MDYDVVVFGDVDPRHRGVRVGRAHHRHAGGGVRCWRIFSPGSELKNRIDAVCTLI